MHLVVSGWNIVTPDKYGRAVSFVPDLFITSGPNFRNRFLVSTYEFPLKCQGITRKGCNGFKDISLFFHKFCEIYGNLAYKQPALTGACKSIKLNRLIDSLRAFH